MPTARKNASIVPNNRSTWTIGEMEAPSTTLLRFHNDFWLAFSWGAFPVLTAYWVNALRFDVAVVMLAVACFLLTLVQRTLSTPVRTIRRKALRVDGRIELANGERIILNSKSIIAVPERALLLLAAAAVALAISFLVFRLQTQ